MASENIVIISNENWQSEVIESSKPVLVDFWAEWCAPCRAIAPTLDQVADELAGKLKVAKVDVDSNPQLAAEFGVRSIPTLLVMKGGAVAEQMTGAMSKNDLMAKLESHLA